MNEAERLSKLALDAKAEADRRGNLALELMKQAAEWENYALEMAGLSRIAAEAGGVHAPGRSTAQINRAAKYAFDTFPEY